MAIKNPSNIKTPEQLHYESLISFFKWSIGIAGALIGVIATVAIYISYSDRAKMKEEYSNTINELQSQIINIRDDAKKNAKETSDDAKETSKSIKEDLRYEVAYTKEYS